MTVADLLKIELEKTQKELDKLKLLLPDVVSAFFCEDEDLEYSSKKCKKQCSGCKWIENL